MKLLARDEKLRLLKLKVECEEDLWALYNVLEKGDVVYARTTRELKAGSGSRRKPMVLGVRLEWAEFQPFTTRLRMHGVIVEGPKELDLINLRHTLNLDVGSEVTIFKEDGWSREQLRAIREACERTSIKGIVVGVDDEEYCVALVRDYGVQVLMEGPMRLPGKLDPSGREAALKARLRELAEAVASQAKSAGADAIILAGPGFVKDRLADAIRELGEPAPVYRENTSSGGVSGVHEALRREAITKALRGCKAVEEAKLLGELLKVLAKNERMAALSLEEVEEAAEAGAVEKLLVIRDLVRAYDEALRRRVESIMRAAEGSGAEVRIFEADHDAYQQLKGLGGIAAILRYEFRGRE